MEYGYSSSWRIFWTVAGDGELVLALLLEVELALLLEVELAFELEPEFGESRSLTIVVSGAFVVLLDGATAGEVMFELES